VLLSFILFLGAYAETYHLVAIIDLAPAGNVTGHGDWVAYDRDTDTVWLSHQPAKNVVVLDNFLNRIRVIIPNVESGNGIAFNSLLAFVADYGTETVKIYDKHNYHLLQTLSTPGGPDGVYWDSVSRALWVTLDDSSSIAQFLTVLHPNSIFDPFEDSPTAHIPLNTTAASPAGPDVGVYVAELNRIYQPIDNFINVIDVTTRKINATWTLPFTGSAKGISFDPNTTSLILGTSVGKAFIVNAHNGHVIATIPVPGAIDESAVDYFHRRAFLGDKAGFFDVINLEDHSVQSVATAALAHSLAIAWNEQWVKVWSYYDQENKVGVYLASF